MFWVKIGGSNFQLVVLPLHGRENKGGTGTGVKVIEYEKPKDPKMPWKRHLIDESMYLTYNVATLNVPNQPSEMIFIGEKEGMKCFA